MSLGAQDERIRVVRWPDWKRTKLTPKHHTIFISNAKKMLVNAGRAFGKDHVLFLRGQRLMFELYSERQALRDAGEWTRFGPLVKVGVYAPESNNFEDLWKRFKEMLPDIPGVAPDGGPQVRIYDKKNEEAIEIFGELGIYIRFFSVLRKDASRGNGFDILLGTEVAYGREETLTGNLIYLVLRPDHAGYIMLNSTPGGPGCWWDRAIEEARRKDSDTYWGSWELHEGDLYDNPRTTETEIAEAQAAKRGNIYKYRRERLAWLNQPHVTDDVLAGNRNFAFEPALIDSCLVSQPVRTTGPYYAGTDLAFHGSDELWTVVIDDPTGLVCAIYRMKKCGVGDILRHFEEVHEKWHPVRHAYDASGVLARDASEKLSHLRHLRLMPVVTQSATSNGKDTKAEHVKHAVQHMVNGTLKLINPEVYPGLTQQEKRDHWELLMQLRGYREIRIRRESITSKGGIDTDVIVTYSKPPDGADDGVDAVVYCLLPRKVRTRPVTVEPLRDWEIFG